jgi:hypothetical protein
LTFTWGWFDCGLLAGSCAKTCCAFASPRMLIKRMENRILATAEF